MWEVMFWPIVACVLLPWLLVYLGLHVVQRGIIFVDIAMAQMASLGICVALLFRLDLHGWRFGNVSRFLLESEFSISFCAEIFCWSHLIAIAPTRKDCGCDGGTFCFTPALGWS